MASAYPESYWAATAHPRVTAPSLRGTAEADVCVIGGGFTGLAAALSAAEAGFSVILLEARRIGWGASGRNGGQMIPGLRLGAAELVERFGLERGRALFRLAVEARDRVHDRIERHGLACDLRSGHFYAAWKPSHARAMADEVDALERLMDYPHARLVPKAGVPAIVAMPRYHGGLFDAKGGHFHPLNYALGLAQAAEAAGVTIHEDTPTTAIEDGDRVRITTPHGDVTARFAVLACDTEIGDVAPRLGRMTMPIANYNIATEPLGPEGAAALIPSDAAIADSRFVLNYYRLSADHRLIFGGGERYSARPPRDIAAFVRPFLAATFPALAAVPIAYGWGGMVGVTRDRLPHLGRMGKRFFAHGYSGQGVLLATLAGELIAEAMRGTAERFDIFAALPHSPFPGGALLRHPLHVAGMLYYAMRDRM